VITGAENWPHRANPEPTVLVVVEAVLEEAWTFRKVVYYLPEETP